MDQSESINLQLIQTGILGMFLLATSLIAFFVLYQKKLLKQERARAKERLEHQRQLLQAVVDAQEKERERIGRDLHDDIGSMLTAAHQFLQKLEQNHFSGERESIIGQVGDLLQKTSSSVRGISRELAPTVLAKLGLVKAIESLSEMMEANGDLVVVFYADPLPNLSNKIATHLYRMVQELFNNTLKHANANHVLISLKYIPPNLRLSFQDDGVGFGKGDIEESTGLGLKSIHSRLNLLDGKLHLTSTEEEGTKFEINIPYNKPDNE